MLGGVNSSTKANDRCARDSAGMRQAVGCKFGSSSKYSTVHSLAHVNTGMRKSRTKGQ